MSKFRDTFRIESARLKDWDYSNPWWYYITINTKDHIEYFGRVLDGVLVLDNLGKITENYWTNIPKHFSNVELDYYVIMPNHIRGIVILKEYCRDVACNVTTKENNFYSKISPLKNSLSTIIRSFKSAVTKYAHENGFINFQWQNRFYDRIIRNEKELYNIRKYIELNPMKGNIEFDNPENIFVL
jgi:REP element-mobilizing transposase RayT